MKKVLLVSDGLFHPPLPARKALLKALAELDQFEVEQISSMEKLPNHLNEFSAMVIYLHHKRISQSALDGFDKYISAGGGVLGIHTATASFKQQRHYFKILGGRFIEHGKVQPFNISPRADTAIFSGIPSFTITDELYLHELESGLSVHFTANHNDQEVPVVWTYQYGQGRVCYAAPGHTTKTIKHPLIQEILRRGLQWVAA